MSIKRLLLQAIYHCKYGPFLHDETWIWRSHPPPPLHLCVRVASGPWKVLRPPAIVCATYSCNLSVRKLLTKSPGCALLVAACPKLARDPVYEPPVPLGPAVWPVLDSSNFRSEPTRTGLVENLFTPRAISQLLRAPICLKFNHPPFFGVSKALVRSIFSLKHRWDLFHTLDNVTILGVNESKVMGHPI